MFLRSPLNVPAISLRLGGPAGAFRITDHAAVERFVVHGNGRVGIGVPTPSKALDVAGDAHVTGTLTGNNVVATWQDLAEWVPTNPPLKTGTVVTIDNQGGVRASNV